MYGYTKIAMAVPKVSLADVKGNLKDIKEKNKGSTTNYNDAIGAGYVPCKKCNP